MHINRTSSYVKDVIAEDTGKPKRDIRHAHDLANKYKYDGLSKRALAPKLRAHFASKGDPIPGGLHPSETEKAKTVGDLVLVIQAKFKGN